MDLLDSAKATASLAPGFRFHPTDEELVRYYLRRKLCGKPFRFDAISEIDIYKVEPWDLPGKSKLKSRDLEWYFFSVLDKKYGNGSRTNRATDRGYWKTTGKDRAVYHRTRTVGMKKTLVYHNGRAPTGQRTNWVMHEYRLIDEEMEKAGISQDAFVLCRIFQKSGSGPKNGEQYGAPLIEEEWDDFELDIVPKDEHTRELAVCDDAYLDEHDLEQILGAVDPLHDTSIAVNSSIRDENGYVEEHRNFNDNAQGTFVVVDENKFVQVQPDDRALFNLPVQDSMEVKSVNDEYIGDPGYRGESSNTMNPLDVDYMLDLPFLDAIDDLPSGDMSFIETNDLQQPVDSDSSSYDLINEYLQFFDATDDNLQNIGFEYSDMMHSEELSSDPALFLPYKDASVGNEQEAEYGKQLSEGISHDPATSLKQAQTKQSDYQYQFIKQASNMLGDVSAPPALASEFPTKDGALRLGSAYASSARVSAGILQIRKVTFGGLGKKWSNGEHDLANTILSFGLSRGDSNSADSQLSSGLSEKANSTVSRGWFYFMFMWVLFLSTSIKIGAYILAK